MIRLLFTLSLLISLQILFAQPSPDAICQEGDCPADIFAIQLNEPAQPASYSAERTEKFKQAYLAFKSIRENLRKDIDWKEKYDAFQLGGETCLRYYQLESSFGTEFLNNPDFKSFVEKEDPQSAPLMSSNGFRSSRRAVNLARRMETHCPDKKKSAEQKGGTPVKTTANEYQELGYALGYFDKDGKVIKELEPPKEYKPRNKMSKNERVENLQNKVAALPLGPDVKKQVDKATDDLRKAGPKLAGLKNFLSSFMPSLKNFSPKPKNLLGKLGKATDLLDKLKDSKFKCPQEGLLGNAKDLFGKGTKLSGKLKNLVGNSDGLRDNSNLFKNKTDKLGQGIKDNATELGNLAKMLNDLEQKKQSVLDKLGDKPKKILEELEQEVAGLEEKARMFKDLLEVEVDKKNKLLKQLDDLVNQKDQLEKTLNTLQGENKELEKAGDDLQKAADEVRKQIEAAQKKEDELEQKIKKLEELPDEQTINESLKICKEDLVKLIEQIGPVETAQTKLNEKMKKVRDLPEKLLDKVKRLKIFQNGLAEWRKRHCTRRAFTGKAQ